MGVISCSREVDSGLPIHSEGIVTKDDFDRIPVLNQRDYEKWSDPAFEFKILRDGKWYLGTFYKDENEDEVGLSFSEFVESEVNTKTNKESEIERRYCPVCMEELFIHYITPSMVFKTEDSDLIREDNNDIDGGDKGYIEVRCSNDGEHIISNTPGFELWLSEVTDKLNKIISRKE